MPLAHFTNIHSATAHTGEPIYLPEKVLCFDKHESKQVFFSKNFFLFYPFNDKEKEKYLNEFKSVTFEETDEFRNLLLKEKPSELKFQTLDREGRTVREIRMYEVEYEELPEYEVKIRFKKFEDKYF